MDPNSQSQSPSSSSSSSNSGGSSSMIKAVVIVVLLLILGGGAYYFYAGQNKPVTESTTTQTAQPTSMEKSDSMTNEDKMDEQSEEGAVKTFDLTAKNYEYSIKDIQVNKGDTVEIILTVEQGMHDWVVDEFDAKTDVVNAGQTTKVSFVADEAGTFEYYCSVGNHRQQGMVGTLTVE